MVKVIDAPFASGKTNNMIQEINNNPNEKYLIVVTTIGECERYQSNCKNLSFNIPTNESTKATDELRDLLVNQSNVVTTESCFQNLIDLDVNLLKDYVLVLDGEINPFNTLLIKKGDMNLLIEKNVILFDEETKQIKWIFEVDEKMNKKFEKLKYACETSRVYYIKNRTVYWELSKEYFDTPKKVIILSYQFEKKLMNLYFQKQKIQYEIKKFDDTEFKAKAKKLINIFMGKTNKSMERISKLNKSNMNKLKEEDYKKISDKIKNYFRLHATKKENVAWTTFKSMKNNLKGPGYTKKFIPCNCKGTNEYAHVNTLAYVLNVYLTPDLKDYFKINNIEVSDDDWALSMLLQWLWRSAIRNNEPINVFIPSKRMRDLLINWLG